MNNNLSCIIVDDEPLAQNLLCNYIKRVHYLSLKATFYNAIEAAKSIPRVKPDIIFMDVNMPEMTGVDFLQSFTEHRVNTIITTSYPQYAFDGFEYDIIDYLLKPISFSRFLKAINKAIVRTENKSSDKSNQSEQEDFISSDREEIFWIKADKKFFCVKVKEVLYVEGMKDYVKIYLLNDKNIITHITMTKMIKFLLPFRFIRINRSFIINLDFVELLEGNMLKISNGSRLTIGVTHRDKIKGMIEAKLIQ